MSVGNISVRAQHLVACDGIAESCSKKDVRWKMSTRHYARKTDSGCETVQGPRHPAVVVISAGNDRTDSKHTSGVPGWEGAALKGRFTAIEERVVKRSSSGNITRSFSASNRLKRKVDHSAVSVGLPGE